MHDAVLARVAGQDVFIAVAAVADWRVANAASQKLKKQTGKGTPTLEFEENPGILARVAALPDAPYCVGFAAESENLIEHGAAKRERKNVPLLVGNLGPNTFGRDTNELVLFDESGHVNLPAGDKQTLATQLVQELARRIAQPRPQAASASAKKQQRTA
jgi:phosphopantothenoylcysteine decarboxylase/phosphopantothenate--cysteine ligase